MGKKRKRQLGRGGLPAARRRWLVGAAASLLLIVLGVAAPRLLTDGGGSTSAVVARSRSSVPLERLRVKVLASYPHDPQAYTQGLVWHPAGMLESTGSYGGSSLRRYRLETGTIDELRRLDPDLFGEGLALVGDRVIQITWKAGLAIVYRLGDLEEEERLSYVGEGWGLCFDGERLVMSDGSHLLALRDPRTLTPLGQIEVTRRGHPLDRLNELECVDGFVYANVFLTDEIVKIDAENGRVVATIDASDLLTPAEAAAADVLNGIAYREETGTFLLTGKNWPRIFEVELVPLTP